MASPVQEQAWLIYKMDLCNRFLGKSCQLTFEQELEKSPDYTPLLNGEMQTHPKLNTHNGSNARVEPDSVPIHPDPHNL